MIRSWIISGEPRTIHTSMRVNTLSGFTLDMDPKAISRPSGSAPSSVTKNSFIVCKNPMFSERTTMGNC